MRIQIEGILWQFSDKKKKRTQRKQQSVVIKMRNVSLTLRKYMKTQIHRIE